MKFSEKWLREWVNPDISSDELVSQLNMLGLEVDSVDKPPVIEGVVVGHVLSVERHPDANKLSVCEVSRGDSVEQVVCGAPNVRAGMKTAFATVGAILPSGMKIKKAKLRGVESFGMLCSDAELELSDAADGIMELSSDAPAGQKLTDYLDLNDTVIEIDITPNRGDCFCIRGIARDISARNNVGLLKSVNAVVKPETDDTVSVSVLPDNACVTFTGRVIDQVDNSVSTPLWMVEKLRRSGIRSISPVVDITAYVMLELGQPMHAYDVSKLTDGIIVRHAESDEKLRLLDGREVTLENTTTVIADGRGAIGLAGIMGGDSTGCDDNSRKIFLESALFLPERVAGKSRSYSTHTDAGHRFERGVDPGGQQEALDFAAQLVLEICGGKVGPLVEHRETKRQPFADPIILRRSRIKRLLGIEVADAEVESILSRLGIVLESTAQGWQAQVPSYRYDLRIEADLIEEIARVYGYQNLPRTFPDLSPEFGAVNDLPSSVSSAKNLLITRGYQEVVTYSFIDDQLHKSLFPEVEYLPLANPISSDLSAMRTSLLPGLINTLRKNLNRQHSDIRIFETGLSFSTTTDGLQQNRKMAALISGRAFDEHWSDPDRKVDFFDLKGDLEALFDKAHLTDIEFVAGTHTVMHPGQCAEVKVGDESVGWIGSLHPNLQKTLDLSQTAIVFEINQDILETDHIPEFEEISRYPAVRRDIAILIDSDVPMSSIQRTVLKNAPEYLKKVVVFDIYRGDKVAKGLKSVALGLILQDNSRTLEENEVENSVAGIIKVLEEKFSATLRM